MSPDLAGTLATLLGAAVFGQLVPPAHQGHPIESTRTRSLIAAGGALAIGALLAGLSSSRAPLIVAAATAGGLVLVNELAAAGERIE